MVSILPTNTQIVEDAEFARKRQVLQPEKRKTQKLKISVVNVKFTFVLANALKISIPSLATEYRVLKF